jgi:M6 family metalloprotease-like protein
MKVRDYSHDSTRLTKRRPVFASPLWALQVLVILIAATFLFERPAGVTAEQNAARATRDPVQSPERAHLLPSLGHTPNARDKSSSEAPAQPQFIGEKATTATKDADLELHVLSPPFSPTFRTTGAGVELIGTATGPNQIIQISWSSNLGEFGIAQGSSSWRSGRIPLTTGNNSITVTATDASNSSVANPWIQTAPLQTLEGTLEIVWGDPQPGSGSDGDIRYALRLSDGSVVPLQLTGQEGVAVFYFRKRVLVTGWAVPSQAAAGNVEAAATLVVDSIAPSQTAQSDTFSTVTGTKKVIYLLTKFSDDAAVPHPPAFYTDLNNPDTPPAGEVFPTTINAFFKKISGNAFSWVGDVGGVGGVGAAGGWLTLPHPKSYYANCGWSTSCANLGALGDDATALGRAQGINFTLYDNINFVLSNDLDCCAWGGGYSSTVDNKSYGATWEPPWGQNTDTYGHEMGHSLGLPHSGWVYSAYDSPWDIMSNRQSLNNVVCGSYTSRNSGNALANVYCSEPGDGYIIDHRDYLGWIPAANQVVTNTSPGTTVALEASALPFSSGIKEIKICLPSIPCTGSTAHYFTVEARVKGLGATSQFDNAIPGEGVIIHEVIRNRSPISGTCFFNNQSGWAVPIDATPGDYDSAACNSGGRVYPNYGLFNAQWLPGQTYTNATYGLTIAVLSRTGSTFMVAIGGGGGGTRSLTVASSNPSSGVSITVSPNDNNNQGSGTTQFTRTYNNNTSVNLTAPATASGNNFQKWQRDGADWSTSTSTSLSMDANHTMTAVYTTPVVTRTLTVASSNPSSGVSITVSPNDNNGQGGGTTQFTRVYNNNTNLSLTAPSTAGGNNFQKWQLDGVDLTTSLLANFVMDANHTMTAVYLAGPAGNAVYDSTRKAPSCGQVGSICDSGNLLNGRDTISGGPEPNQPNTINNSCADRTSGTYHVDESVDRIKVSTVDGGAFALGKLVKVDVTLWVYESFSSDHLDLYYAADASNPNWIYLTTIEPSGPGVQVPSATYTLPSAGSLQAIRANFRFTGAPSPCGTNSGYEDYDDLVFAVGSSLTNYALASNGGVASASSTLDAARTANAANNGDRRGQHWGSDPSTGSGWHDATSNSYPDWVQIDFAGAKTINEIDVFTVQDNYNNPSEPTDAMTFGLYGITGFDVQYWTGSAWATVPGGSVSGNNKVKRTFTFSPITSSSIRVSVNNALAGYSRITEVEAWGTTTSSSMNVALAANGGLASASSTLDAGRAASAANNGDRKGQHWGTDPATGSGWHDATSNSFPDWLQIDFNGAKTINQIDIFTIQDNYANPSEPTDAMTFGTYGITAFDVQYWSGSTWTTVLTGNASGNNKVKRTFTFPSITTAKVRVLVNNALAGYSRITEVEVWGTAASSNNVALASNGGVASASSTLDSGRLAGAANNGDRKGQHWGTDPSTGSGWHDATSNTYPDWLQIDFAGSKTISQINVFTVQDNYSNPSEPTDSMTFGLYGISAFDVQYWTGSAWITVPGGSVFGNSNVKRTFTFSPIATTKIRVLVNNALAGHSRITEVEAFEGP